MEIAKVLGREAQKDRPGNTACEHLAVRSADAAPVRVGVGGSGNLAITAALR